MTTFIEGAEALVRAGADLTMRQAAVLVAAVRTPPADRQDVATVRALCVALNVSKPAITRAFDRLEADGLGERKTHPHDKRVVFLVPTPLGAKIARDMMGVQAA